MRHMTNNNVEQMTISSVTRNLLPFSVGVEQWMELQLLSYARLRGVAAAQSANGTRSGLTSTPCFAATQRPRQRTLRPCSTAVFIPATTARPTWGIRPTKAATPGLSIAPTDLWTWLVSGRRPRRTIRHLRSRIRIKARPARRRLSSRWPCSAGASAHARTQGRPREGRRVGLRGVPRRSWILRGLRQ
jgi:hypothetical protein